MKLKSIALSLLLITLSGCAGTATKSNEVLQLEGGSKLIVDNGTAVQLIDKSGATLSVEKSRMMELSNGDFIYIRKDGTVNKLEKSNDSSQGHSSKSSSGHSH